MITFEEFCERVQQKALSYMSEEFSKNNYSISLQENKDNYDIAETVFLLLDARNPGFEAPALSVNQMYENYRITRDAEKIIRYVAEQYEKQYRMEVFGFKKDSKTEKPEEKEVLNAVSEPGDVSLGITEIYAITAASEKPGKAVLQEESDELFELLQNTGQTLALLPEGNVVLAVPVKTKEDYQECLDTVKEIRENMKNREETEAVLYDPKKNILLKSQEDIKELLEQEEKPVRKSVFSRK